VFDERRWSPVNTPVLGPDGQVAWTIHRVEDVTAFVLSQPLRPQAGGPLGEREAMEAEVYARARELQRLNEELRQAHARERRVAVTLQKPRCTPLTWPGTRISRCATCLLEAR
jgi:hypothetical protein